MKKKIAVVATMDTKGVEASFVRSELRQLGCEAVLIDIGVIGEPTTAVDYTREQVAAAAGSSLTGLLQQPTRQTAAPIMVAGAAKILLDLIEQDQIAAAAGMGGTQGTTNCAEIFQKLPYGFPKIILSTIASGDVSALVDINDITMMPSVADIIGLNPLTRKMLSNLAGAAFGMAQSVQTVEPKSDSRGVIGVTNLGVLTEGTTRAIRLLEAAGFEVITFHAVGSGGRAMERMIRESLITGVFDYALGEISDQIHGGLRAGDESRLTVAAEAGLPQVVVPGGAEHIGVWVEPPNTIPDRFAGRPHTFHNPRIYVPRLTAEELVAVGEVIGQRLQKVQGNCTVLLPEKGVSRYSVEGGPLHDPEADAAFFSSIRANAPAGVKVESLDFAAEDHGFIDAAVGALDRMMSA